MVIKKAAKSLKSRASSWLLAYFIIRGVRGTVRPETQLHGDVTALKPTRAVDARDWDE